jgi:hypothetical protein
MQANRYSLFDGHRWHYRIDKKELLMSDTIRVTVDDEGTLAGCADRQARSSIEDLVSSCLRKTLSLQADTLAHEVGDLYATVLGVLDAIPRQDKGYSVTSVSFSIVLDSEGKASLFSAVSAGAKAQAGFTFVISWGGDQP